MTIDKDNIIESILESISRIDYMKTNEIPNIPLYMDQVTTLMESQLQSSKRFPEDKILTKTMINNYAKNNLLPPPEKKKYTQNHVLILIFIYYFKNILSIKDIEKLLNPITDNYFDDKSELSIADIYNEVFDMKKDCIDTLKEDIAQSYAASLSTFGSKTSDDSEATDSSDSDPNKQYLQLFSFICALSFDVYVKKQIIEELIDTFPFEELESSSKPKK